MMMWDRKVVVAILVVVISIAAITWAIFVYFEQKGSIQNLLAKAKLERRSENLRAKGIPIEYVDIDNEIGCLVVAFKDMESEYVEPIREIVGYDLPVLFRELELKRVLVGEPPVPLLNICEALNLLTESLDYYTYPNIDAERGLLRLRFRDLTDEEIQKIRGLVGHDVPIEFEEREWKDQLYIGKPPLSPKTLEDAQIKLYEADNELVSNAISGTTINENVGFLEIDLWELDKYAETIEAIRDVVDHDVPLVFVLTHRKMPEIRNFTSAFAALEDYVNKLNLPDIGYEIVWQTEDKAEASLYFLINGEQVQFQKLDFHKTNGYWEWVGFSKWRVPSPSQELEIVGYLVSIPRINGRKCVSNVQPLVKNLDDETAYILSVQLEMRNSTHIFQQSYGTVGKGLMDGLIRPGKIKTVGAVMPRDFWTIEESGETIFLFLDYMRGKTYEITIILKDGEGNILAENTFIHTFAFHIS